MQGAGAEQAARGASRPRQHELAGRLEADLAQEGFELFRANA
jgi:hypothetical protein